MAFTLASVPRRFFCALLLFGALLVGCRAQIAVAQKPAPSAQPRTVRAVRAARLFDPRAGRILKNVIVTLAGDRIESVATGAPPTRDASILDLGDVTLLPGLIDAHSHLMSNHDKTYLDMLVTKSEAYRTLEGAAHARATLRAGFTTVRDCGNEGLLYADVALRDAIDQGLVEGPRMLVATRAIAAVGGYFPFAVSTDLAQQFSGAQFVSGVEEARRAAREQLQHGADLLKLYADFPDGPRTWTVHPTLTVDEMKAAVEIAHTAGRKVAAHATSAQGIRNALAAGVDSIEHGDEANDPQILRTMKDRGVFLVPTQAALADVIATIPAGAMRDKLEVRRRGAQRTLQSAHAAGVKIAAGFDASKSATQGQNAREVITLSGYGLGPVAALRSATLRAAELLGWEDRIGSIEKGRFADLIAVRGDPTTDIRALQQVVFVMKGGTVVVRSAP